MLAQERRGEKPGACTIQNPNPDLLSGVQDPGCKGKPGRSKLLCTVG